MRGRMLRATICEIERGLFQISYRTESPNWDVDELPPYVVGTCATDVQQRINEQAQKHGFEAVVWDYALVVPELDSTSEIGPSMPEVSAGD